MPEKKPTILLNKHRKTVTKKKAQAFGWLGMRGTILLILSSYYVKLPNLFFHFFFVLLLLLSLLL